MTPQLTAISLRRPTSISDNSFLLAQGTPWVGVSKRYRSKLWIFHLTDKTVNDVYDICRKPVQRLTYLSYFFIPSNACTDACHFTRIRFRKESYILFLWSQASRHPQGFEARAFLWFAGTSGFIIIYVTDYRFVTSLNWPFHVFPSLCHWFRERLTRAPVTHRSSASHSLIVLRVQ